MQSFHHSRARIAFDVLCALGLAASLVGAWMQTYAPAFVPAAAIAALYGVVRASDLVRRKPAAVVVAPEVEPPVAMETSDAVIRSWPLPAPSMDEPKPVEPPAAKAPRKKRKSAKAEVPVEVPQIAGIETESAAPVESDVVPLHAEPEQGADDPRDAADEAPAGDDDEPHGPLAPLFEPEPFVRQQQRAVFGRKAG